MAFSGQTFSAGQVLTATQMNQLDTNIDEVRTTHIGTTAPAELAAGVRWIDNSSTPWIDQVYDGTDWITIGTINATTNVYTYTATLALSNNEFLTGEDTGGTAENLIGLDSSDLVIVGDAGHATRHNHLYQAFGNVAPLGFLQNYFGGNFTSSGADTYANKFHLAGALTGASGDTGHLEGARFVATITTQAVAETIADVSQVRIEEPNITNTTATITNASTLLITSSPTEGGSNYTIKSEGTADSLFDGAIKVAATGGLGVSEGGGTGARLTLTSSGAGAAITQNDNSDMTLLTNTSSVGIRIDGTDQHVNIANELIVGSDSDTTSGVFAITGAKATSFIMQIEDTTDSAGIGPVIKLFRNPGNAMANGDDLAAFDFHGTNSAAADTRYGRYLMDIQTVTSTAEDGRHRWQIVSGGTLGDCFGYDGANEGFYITTGGTLINPDGTLHVQTASAGTVTADSNADDLVVENSAAGGISILCPDSVYSRLYFGSPTANFGANIAWSHDNQDFNIGTNISGGHIDLTTGVSVQAVRIDGNQDVGIGTTTQNARLTVQDSVAALVEFESTLATSTTSGPNLYLWRNGGNANANDAAGGILFDFESSTGVRRTGLRVFEEIETPTNGSEDARWRFQAMRSGTLGTKLYIGNGIYTVTASGGDQGLDTVNAGQLFRDGVEVFPTELQTETSLSGATTDITGIPSWAQEITITIEGASGSAAGSSVFCQIGDAGGIETTGYVGETTYVANDTDAGSQDMTAHIASTGGSTSAADVYDGTIILTLKDATNNTWVSNFNIGDSGGNKSHFGGGSKSLSATLDRIRIGVAAGTFDAGSINVLVK